MKMTGTASSMLGAAAVAAVVCPWLLPSSASPQIRSILFSCFLPLGICAVVSGTITLREMRGDEGANRRRARAGITLGAVAVVVPMAAIVWACWSLTRAGT